LGIGVQVAARDGEIRYIVTIEVSQSLDVEANFNPILMPIASCTQDGIIETDTVTDK